MTSFTTPKTYTSNSALTAAELNTYQTGNIKNLDERLTVHGLTSESTVQYVLTAGKSASITDTSGQNVGNNSSTFLSFGTEDWDDDSFYDAGQPTRLTVPEDGKYRITAGCRFQNNSSGYRSIVLYFDAATVAQESFASTSGINANTSISTPTRVYDLTAAQYVRAQVYQNSGSSLQAIYLFMQIEKVSE